MRKGAFIRLKATARGPEFRPFRGSGVTAPFVDTIVYFFFCGVVTFLAGPRRVQTQAAAIRQFI